MSVAAPGYVHTIARMAQMLGEDEDWLHDLAAQLEPEDGCFWIYDAGARATPGLTGRGVEGLQKLILDQER